MSLNHVCDVCKRVFQRPQELLIRGLGYENEFYKHHQTWTSFQNSVLEDCWICSRFEEAMTADEKANMVQLLSGVVHFNSHGNRDHVTRFDLGGLVTYRYYRLTVDFWPSWKISTRLVFNMTRVDDQPPSSKTAHDIEGTSSSSSIKTATVWLQNCIDHHPSCNTSTSKESWYPTRVLQLNTASADPALARLVLTADEALVGPYATLSHCWGLSEFIQLTKSNLVEFCAGIKIKDMPQTFQDTIAVCMRLNIRYLWIDSLCIMQDKDDLSDWLREASLMDRVYSSSYLNIAASDAPNGTHGLFRKRTASTLLHTRVQVAQTMSKDDLALEEHNLEDSNLWYHGVEETTLSKRGWVFQERLLAPRVLHFGRHQLFWECRSLNACEKYPQGMPHPLQRGYLKAMYPHGMLKELEMCKPKKSKRKKLMQGYRDWELITERYRDTSLTKSSDKLVALSGIAKRFAVGLNDEYIAGMWRSMLLTDLLWIPRSESCTRPANYRAPTWSWASIDGQVDLASEDHAPSRYMVSIEDVVLIHKTQDITGQVESGHIDLRGYLKPLSIAVDPSGAMPSIEATLNGFHAPFNDHAIMRGIDDTTISLSGLQSDSDEHRLYHMVFYVNMSDVIWMTLRLVDHQNGTFERIGLTTTYRYKDQALYNELETPLNKEEAKKLPCLRYEDGKHTIRII